MGHTVTALNSAATGLHRVLLAPVAISTTEGDGSGQGDTEDFDVEKLAVNVQGPPYVIVDNAPTTVTQLPNGGSVVNYPPNVDSEYNAIAIGGSGNYSWAWTPGAGISYESGWYSTSNPVDVYGIGPTGPSSMACSAYDEGSGTSQGGSLPVTVQDEYVTKWTSETDGPAQPDYQYTLVGPQTSGAANQVPPGSPITVSVTQSVGVDVGVTLSGDIPGTDFGLDIGTSVSTEVGAGGSVNVPLPAEPAVANWDGCLVGMVYTVDGTGFEYGPEGVVSTDTLTEVKKADPYADAFDSNGGIFALYPPTTPVNPVQP